MKPKIYVAHSSNFDFKNELYLPLRNSVLNTQYDFFLPHENDQLINSKEIIQHANLVLAEVSYPSTGQGIELGWANIFQIPIVCIFHKDVKISSSLRLIAQTFLTYENTDDLIAFLATQLSTNFST